MKEGGDRGSASAETGGVVVLIRCQLNPAKELSNKHTCNRAKPYYNSVKKGP